MISICKQYVDHEHMMGITVLINSFGAKQIVQTPLLGGDHQIDVNQVIADMAATERAYIAELKRQFGYSDAQIQAMMKNPKDCGCS